MPRVFKQNNVAQKHKSFKGSKKRKNEGPLPQPACNVYKTKGIKKVGGKQRTAKVAGAGSRNHIPSRVRRERELTQLEQKLKVNSYLDSGSKSRIQQLMKKEPGIKIVLLLPFNADANTEELKSLLQHYISLKEEGMKEVPKPEVNQHIYPYFTFFAHPKNFPGLVQENLTFIAGSRNIEHVLDLCKVADVIVPVLSCRSTNTQGLALDPYGSGKAFDDHGYTLMNILKNQGIPSTVSVIQHLDTFEGKHYEKVGRLFRRYFETQFGQQQRVLPVSKDPTEIFQFLRCLQNTTPIALTWRENRGYMLAETASYDNSSQKLIVSGFLKGNCINANQLVHITGLDDFEIESIEIIPSKSKLQRFREKKKPAKDEATMQDETPLIQHCTINDELFPFHKEDVNHDPEQLTSAFNNLAINKMPLLNADVEMQAEEQPGEEQQDVSFDDQPHRPEDKQLQKKNRVEMQTRAEDELQFEDELDYPADVSLRDKLSDYRGLASFRKTQWNPLQNLPDEYSKIFVFKNQQMTRKSAYVENKEKGFAYPNFYVKITIKNVPFTELQKLGTEAPLVLSFLFKHERKMTMQHFRVKRNPYYHDTTVPVESGQNYYICFGFRKIFAQPIFSRCFNGCDKTKYRRSFVDYDSHYFCSFYYYNVFPPANVAIYRVEGKVPEQMPIMYGEMQRADPMHVILERVILTGYPFKINKRRATVRFMFFQPKDVKYFRPVELITKLGLRGNIEQSLGTHGLMKCFFSDRIKPNDTICLYLYKRVFPKAPF